MSCLLTVAAEPRSKGEEPAIMRLSAAIAGPRVQLENRGGLRPDRSKAASATARTAAEADRSLCPALACQEDSDEGTESGLDVRDEQVQRIEPWPAELQSLFSAPSTVVTTLTDGRFLSSAIGIGPGQPDHNARWSRIAVFECRLNFRRAQTQHERNVGIIRHEPYEPPVDGDFPTDDPQKAAEIDYDRAQMRMAIEQQVDDPSYNLAGGPTYLFAEHQDRGRLRRRQILWRQGRSLRLVRRGRPSLAQGTERLDGLSAAI